MNVSDSLLPEMQNERNDLVFARQIFPRTQEIPFPKQNIEIYNIEI